MKAQKYLLFVYVLSLGLAVGARAETVTVAAATNFIAPLKAIKTEFEKSTDHRLVLSFASSGKLFAQISNGAPFDVFLSADQVKPEKLGKLKLARSDSQFTYAIGRLVLWSNHSDVLSFDKSDSDIRSILNSSNYNKLTLANPRLAPYGQAAMEVIKALGAYESNKQRLVKGENIAQSFQFVQSGNASMGFIAFSQLLQNNENAKGSAWIVPQRLYKPIRQDAILTLRGAQNSAALAFYRFLQSDDAQALIQTFGYLADSPEGSLSSTGL